MRIISTIGLLATAATVVGASPAIAQQSLEKLEAILEGEAADEPTPATPLPKQAQPQPIEHEVAEPGYLGLFAIEVDGELIVESVRADSPAEGAKVRAGDRLLRIGAAQPATLDEMSTVLAPLSAGARVPIVVNRNGKQLSLVAILGKRPPAAKEAPRPTPAPAADPSVDSLDALGELERLLADEPPSDDDAPLEREPSPSPAGESAVLRRVATLEAELKLLNARIGELERTLHRVESEAAD